MHIEEALKILDIPPYVTKGEIKKRYKELASKYHPDRSKESKKMVEINEAYKLIMEYIENFRYSFDSNEITKQMPSMVHNDKFKV